MARMQAPAAKDEIKGFALLIQDSPDFYQWAGRPETAGKNKQSTLPAQENPRLHYDLKQLRGGA